MLKFKDNFQTLRRRSGYAGSTPTAGALRIFSEWTFKKEVLSDVGEIGLPVIANKRLEVISVGAVVISSGSAYPLGGSLTEKATLLFAR